MSISECNVRTDCNGRELVEHGTPLFPVSCYDDDLTATPVPWHWHEELEVLVITEGNVLICVGKQKFELSAGEGFFINSGILHAASPIAGSTGHLHSLVFHPRLIGGIDTIFWQNYMQPILSNPCFNHMYLDKSLPWHEDGMHQIANAWNFCAEGEDGYEFQVRYSLSMLMEHLSKHNSASLKRPSQKELRDNERLKQMLFFIQNHYTEEITVSMIANAALVSESECMRCFRSTMSTSPIKYLKQFRIEKAADALAFSDDKIIDIAMNCGFLDVSYFIKSFRESYGLTPAEYRKMKQKLA